ncbi:MAG TPA: hypothetical protein VJ385_18315 [Fibrobacteria bacterium]|nr:hypothetical protein [Fibrobacteria bacterium]
MLILVLPAMLMAQGVSAPSDSKTISPPSQAQASQPPTPAKDSASLKAMPSGKDSLALAPPKSRSDTVIVVKHGFNHREQIITGSVIMSCLALMLVTMNNYNPR